MGNVQKDDADPVDLRIGVWSIWFELSAETITAKAAETEAGITGDYPVMTGVVPLSTFGEQQDATVYEWSFPTEEIPSGGGSHETAHYILVSGSRASQTPPSMLGVRVDADSTMSLVVHIQTSETADCTNTQETKHDATWNGSSLDYIHTDASYVDEAKPEYFGNSGMNPQDGSADADYGTPEITGGADIGHHVIIAWDFTNGCSSHGVDADAPDEGTTESGTDSSSKLWCAIDDVNKSGADLPAMWVGGSDANAVLSFICASIAGKYGDAHAGSPSAALTLSGSSIPYNKPAIPSPITLNRDNVAFTPNVKVRIARRQLFAGVAISPAKLDMSVEENRRAFITSDLKPASLSAARDWLGVIPIDEFNTAADIISGHNSGSSGNFTKTGTVTSFSGTVKAGSSWES